jgi:hypothetical protein
VRERWTALADRIAGGSRNQKETTAALGWAVLLLHVCIVFSIVRTLEYLNVPVWDGIVRLVHAAAMLLHRG